MKPRKVQCLYPECDAPAKQRRLCRLHYTWWPYFRYMRGDPISQRRLRRDGYVEAMVDGIWALEHRLIITRELQRLLERAEIITHIDGNRANNKRENLRMTSQQELADERKREQNGTIDDRRMATE